MNYKNFFEACNKNLYWETERGVLSLYDLFNLPVNDLKQLYITLKQSVIIDDDPLLGGDTSQEDLLKFEIVKDILIFRNEQAKRNELLKKKKQLEEMLEEVKLKRLKEDPEALRQEIAKLEDELNKN